MADIDKRALQGLCCYNVLDRVHYKHKVTPCWCPNPIGTRDEMLCDEHAMLLAGPDAAALEDKKRAYWRRKYREKNPVVRRVTKYLEKANV